MLSYARKQEERIAKESLIKQLLPLWLAHYAVAKLKGEPYMSYDAFMNKTLNDEKPPEEHIKKSERTAAEIEAELMQFVEIDRKKGG